jgi:antitoxin (DNA-binding transcriptional repressor) of toxin-antitoxin stability system
MRAVKIAEAKAQLSKHLRYVKTGGRVRIFDRDEPVADLVPIADPVDREGGWTAAEIADLERRGILTRAKKRGGTKVGPLPPGRVDPLSRASEELIADRRKGR